MTSRLKIVNNVVHAKIDDTSSQKTHSKAHHVHNCPLRHSNVVCGNGNELSNVDAINTVRISRGTQSEKKYSGNAQKSAATTTTSKDDLEIKFAVIEDILTTCKRVTVPLLTLTFIVVYVIVAVRNYVSV